MSRNSKMLIKIADSEFTPCTIYKAGLGNCRARIATGTYDTIATLIHRF